MPKEIVTAAYWLPDEKDPDAEGAPEEQPVAEVRWGRDEDHVSLVTRKRGYEVPPPEADPIPFQYGMHCDLNRRGINELIRHLRRARDQAFGRDE